MKKIDERKAQFYNKNVKEKHTKRKGWSQKLIKETAKCARNLHARQYKKGEWEECSYFTFSTVTTKQLLREWLLVDMFFLTVFLIAIIPGKNKELIVQLLYVDLNNPYAI